MEKTIIGSIILINILIFALSFINPSYSQFTLFHNTNQIFANSIYDFIQHYPTLNNNVDRVEYSSNEVYVYTLPIDTSKVDINSLNNDIHNFLNEIYNQYNDISYDTKVINLSDGSFIYKITIEYNQNNNLLPSIITSLFSLVFINVVIYLVLLWLNAEELMFYVVSISLLLFISFNHIYFYIATIPFSKIPIVGGAVGDIPLKIDIHGIGLYQNVIDFLNAINDTSPLGQFFMIDAFRQILSLLYTLLYVYAIILIILRISR